MDMLKALKRTKELINQGWTQHTLARDDRGMMAELEDASATSFCLLGGLYRACHEQGAGWWCEEVEAARSLLKSRLDPAKSISEYNDTLGRTKAEVIDVLDRVINLEERRLSHEVRTTTR